MHSLKMSAAKMLTSFRERGSADRFGAGGVAVGILLVAIGWILEGEFVGIGTAIRTLGGILFLVGLGTVVLGNARHRAAAIGISKRICAGYMSRTAHWGWPDRVGLAGVAIGTALVVPAVVLQIIFRNGAVIAGPAVLLFWVGIILLIYGRFRGRGKTRPSVPSRGGKHDKRRP